MTLCEELLCMSWSRHCQHCIWQLLQDKFIHLVVSDNWSKVSASIWSMSWSTHCQHCIWQLLQDSFEVLPRFELDYIHFAQILHKQQMCSLSTLCLTIAPRFTWSIATIWTRLHTFCPNPSQITNCVQFDTLLNIVIKWNNYNIPSLSLKQI